MLKIIMIIFVIICAILVAGYVATLGERLLLVRVFKIITKPIQKLFTGIGRSIGSNPFQRNSKWYK